MAANPQSLAIADRYQMTFGRLQAQAAQRVAATWHQVDPNDLVPSYQAWAQAAAVQVAMGQRASAQLAGGYMTAYRQSETVTTAAAPPVAVEEYAGVTRAGLPLAQMFAGTLWAALKQIKDRAGDVLPGPATTAAIAWALARNVRLAGDEVTSAGRRVVTDVMVADPDTFEGWERVTRPSACLVCIAAADGRIHKPSDPLRVHDHCTCVAQPKIAGAPDRARRPTGADRFAAMTADQQDQLAGPEVAKALRDGHLHLGDVIGTQPMAAQDDQLHQRPARDLVGAGQQ
jgi:hypothetical protein